MFRTLLIIISAASLVGLVACGDSGGNPVAQQPMDEEPDQNPDGNPDQNPDNTPDPNPDGTPDPTPDEVNPFEECGGDLGGCPNTQSCMEGVCVNIPAGMTTAVLGYEHRDRVVEVPGGPNIDCYTNPIETGDEVEYVEIRGEVEKFGVGGSTVGLCVTVYNYERFLADRATFCSDDIEDPIAYEECLQADPCRCEKDNEGNQGAIDDCFDNIGYCNGIQDAGKKDTCSQRLAFDGSNPNRDPAFESTLIYGHQIAVVPPDGDTDEGAFTIDGVPTNTHLVIKVSGKKARWIDTYEFGPILTSPAADENDRDADGDTIERFDDWGGNVISIGAWNTIPSTALVPSGIQQGNGAVAGRINDCGLEGRTVEVDGETFDVSGPLPVENATVGFTHDPTRTTYFNGNPDDTLPQPDRITTNKLAVYAAINAPGGFNRVSTSLRLEGSDDLVSIGSRDMFMSPRSVGIITFEGSWAPAAW